MCELITYVAAKSGSVTRYFTVDAVGSGFVVVAKHCLETGLVGA